MGQFVAFFRPILQSLSYWLRFIAALYIPNIDDSTWSTPPAASVRPSVLLARGKEGRGSTLLRYMEGKGEQEIVKELRAGDSSVLPSRSKKSRVFSAVVDSRSCLN